MGQPKKSFPKKFGTKPFCPIFALRKKKRVSELVAQLVEHSDFIGRVLEL